MLIASPSTKRVIGVVLLCAMIMLAPGRAMAQQNIVIDWASDSATPDAYPTTLNRAQEFPVIVKNVNDILYTYEITFVSNPLPPDVFGNISDIIGKSLRAGGALSVCVPVDTLEDIKKKIDDTPGLPAQVAKDIAKLKANESPESVPLQTTLNAWAPIWQKISTLTPDSANNDANCSNGQKADYTKAYPTVLASAQQIQAKAQSSHTIEDKATIGPDTENTFTIKEKFNGRETRKKKIVKFQTGSNRLTLSAGTLFSRVPNRKYESRKTPASTENVLVVEGNSDFRPEGVALLNFELPIPRLDSDTAGFALSAGPVIRFGSSSDTSGLGFFTGVSAHLYRYIYVTPGLHFGEFADFPVGFSEGSKIPANFGELNPVKRWTGRFALGVTFRTKSFSGLGKTETVPKVTDTTATPKPSPTPARADANDSPRFIDAAKRQRLFAPSAPTVYVARNSIPAGFEFPALPDVAPSGDPGLPLTRVVSLSGSETREGLSISVNADAALGDYMTSMQGTRLIMVVPHARTLVRQLKLQGSGLEGADVLQRGDNVVLVFTLTPNTQVKIQQKFNRLYIKLTSPDNVLAVTN